ncbi:MAG: hypothetical protein J1E98_13715 [Lachnospiraceae bacterium]|nr:hypothetical protein [Lachnospiraceae bacterium]
MEYNDTVKLLKECDSGTKMAVSSIDEVLDRVHDPAMKDVLIESKDHHTKLGNEIHTLLTEHGTEDKDPNPMAKGMSWLKTNMKVGLNESDSTIADVLTDGCNMGVKSLHKYLNEYQAADHTSKDICKRLVSIEEELCKDLKDYL